MFASLLTHPDRLHHPFDRLCRELDDVFGVPGQPGSISSTTPGSLPPLNIDRTPQSYEVHVFAPGLDAGKIDVQLDRGVLRIAAERQPARPEGAGKTHVHARERVAGRFSRAISLPDDIDPAQVNASYREGVLQISIARRETAQPQRIAVQ